jgi:hypothetical protein
MKKIIATLMTGLFLVTGISLTTAQPGSGMGRGNGMQQQFKSYMENNIKPELLKQKKIWMDALTKEELKELVKIQEERDAIRSNMQGKVAPENRENTRNAHFSIFKPRLDKIANAHPELKKQYVAEMTQKKDEWIKELESMRRGNNMPQQGRGPMNMMDKITDPAFILMWNPDMNYGKMAMHHKQMRNGQRGGMNKNGMNKGKMNPQMKMAAEPGIHVFPQPAVETVVVKVTGVKNKKVEAAVYNAKGKKVKELYSGNASMPVLTNTLNVAGWDSGLYTVKVAFGERNMTMDFKVNK